MSWVLKRGSSSILSAITILNTQLEEELLRFTPRPARSVHQSHNLLWKAQSDKQGRIDHQVFGVDHT